MIKRLKQWMKLRHAVAEGRKGRFRANGDGLAADRSHGTRRGAFCFEDCS